MSETTTTTTTTATATFDGTKKETTDESHLVNDAKETVQAEDVQMKDEREPVVRTPFRIFYIIGIDWFFVLLGSIASAGSGAMPLLFYLVLGNLIDTLAGAGSTVPSQSEVVALATSIKMQAIFKTKVNWLAGYLAIIAGASFIVTATSTFFLKLANEHIGTRLKSHFFHAVTKQEIGYFDIKKTGAILSYMSDDITQIQDGFTEKVGKFAEHMTQCLCGIGLAFASSWQLSLVIMGAAPLMAVGLGITGKLTEVFQKKATEAKAQAISTANEVISSMRTVRSMAGEEKEQKRFDQKMKKADVGGFGKSLLLALGSGFAFFSIWGCCSLAFWFGGWLVLHGKITVGDLFLVFGNMLIAVMGMGQAAAQIPDFAKGVTSCKSLLRIISRNPAINFKGGKTPNTIVGDIEFKNVCFKYPSRPNVQVLKDFSLTVKSGQTVALVGSSGSGKSTIVALLERFYEPDSGSILLDGEDLRELDPQWLHRNIGIVTQEPVLFGTTIWKNICYALPDSREVTKEDVIEAAKAANAHDFIMSLPDNYQTLLGERGVSLSGGQKQRIAIARAMIQNPSLLLLDEATSALDTESESLVQEALSRLMHGRTSIVVAHRLSTIQDADVIVVMYKGELKEQGKHSELLTIPNGFYYRLAAKQMQFGREDDIKVIDGDDLIGNNDTLIEEAANILQVEDQSLVEHKPFEELPLHHSRLNKSSRQRNNDTVKEQQKPSFFTTTNTTSILHGSSNLSREGIMIQRLHIAKQQQTNTQEHLMSLREEVKLQRQRMEQSLLSTYHAMKSELERCLQESVEYLNFVEASLLDPLSHQINEVNKNVSTIQTVIDNLSTPSNELEQQIRKAEKIIKHQFSDINMETPNFSQLINKQNYPICNVSLNFTNENVSVSGAHSRVTNVKDSLQMSKQMNRVYVSKNYHPSDRQSNHDKRPHDDDESDSGSFPSTSDENDSDLSTDISEDLKHQSRSQHQLSTTQLLHNSRRETLHVSVGKREKRDKRSDNTGRSTRIGKREGIIPHTNSSQVNVSSRLKNSHYDHLDQLRLRDHTNNSTLLIRNSAPSSTPLIYSTPINQTLLQQQLQQQQQQLSLNASTLSQQPFTTTTNGTTQPSNLNTTVSNAYQELQDIYQSVRKRI